MTLFQMFDDANNRTGCRLLDMLLSYNDYELDVKKVFEKNKESLTYIIPIIYKPDDEISIDPIWYDSIKIPNINHNK